MKAGGTLAGLLGTSPRLFQASPRLLGDTAGLEQLLFSPRCGGGGGGEGLDLEALHFALHTPVSRAGDCVFAPAADSIRARGQQQQGCAGDAGLPSESSRLSERASFDMARAGGGLGPGAGLNGEAMDMLRAMLSPQHQQQVGAGGWVAKARPGLRACCRALPRTPPPATLAHASTSSTALAAPAPAHPLTPLPPRLVPRTAGWPLQPGPPLLSPLPEL